MLAHVFEFIPIIMALAALLACGFRANNTTNPAARNLMVIGVVSATLLLITQTSWWVTHVIEGGTSDDEPKFISFLWTIFNTIVMLAFVYAALRREK